MPLLQPVYAVFFGRFTTLAGVHAYASQAINAAGYSRIQLQLWRGDLENAGAMNVTFKLQESMDQDTWTQLASESPGADVQTTVEADISRTWLRVVVELTSSVAAPPVCTLWAIGLLIARRSG